ncbi:Sulfur carrier protein ThiS (thiamine biosynthesis) [Anaerovirgula multivorans]|uniref:Sulfur carrier protein ThiS (Thiamine biosynthesis) n=1 Tax=Anaerovirgula multivorans TaxID=312168 RepID=A0A239AS36_9FIRM|nr:MoaD/ThiS family protein [Anaerovirgula multivorans]SNR98437.1 Sulfur carrier protein ThiS (thiamine biosynthesis) [Anaerovirgula multivorans]
MKTKITLMGPLNKYFNGTKTKKITLSSHATIEDLLKKIGLPREYVSIVAVNGAKVSLDDSLQNEDEVVIYPPVSGG